MNICDTIPKITEIDGIWQFFAWLFSVPSCDLWVFLPIIGYVFLSCAVFYILRYIITNGLQSIIKRFNNF